MLKIDEKSSTTDGFDYLMVAYFVEGAPCHLKLDIGM